LSNSANYLRPDESFAGQMNKALKEAMSEDESVVLGGQLIKYGFAGVTTGLYEKYQDRFITYSVSESLMNSSAMGLALAGKRVVMFHVRIDFLASGMCALVNHIPVWAVKGTKLPIVMLCQIGKGMGQGPQHSKDLTGWFANFEGWTVKVPQTPSEAYTQLKESIFGDVPVLYAVHRELFDAKDGKRIEIPNRVRLCGTSQRHEKKFYR
jgi:pyruvate/2-oxoglutarate/acetoin dehydrogenase E1 component